MYVVSIECWDGSKREETQFQVFSGRDLSIEAGAAQQPDAELRLAEEWAGANSTNTDWGSAHVSA
jgi:hypothetical protein